MVNLARNSAGAMFAFESDVISDSGKSYTLNLRSGQWFESDVISDSGKSKKTG